MQKFCFFLLIFFLFSSIEGRILVPPPNTPQARPGFKFTSPVNWLNDPNGPVYYKGLYHLFYQNFPTAVFPNGPIIWGHAISDNLLDWNHLEPAMIADTPSDTRGVWTGSISLDDNGVPVLFYTGVNGNGEQVTCNARPANTNDILLKKWTKNPNNPIFKQPFANLTGGFRDPNSPWKNPVTKEWNVVVGSGNGNKGAIATLFTSSNLDNNWRFSGFFKQCDKVAFCNGFYECNDFYPLKTEKTGKEFHIFKYSDGDDYYSVGEYNPAQPSFPYKELPNRETMYDWGKGCFYASKSFVDAKGRRLVWGWLREMGTQAGTLSRGWNGVLSVKVVTLTEERMIAMNPLPEQDQLRADKFTFNKVVVKEGQTFRLTGKFSQKMDINFVVPNATASSFKINLRVSDDHREYTSLTFNGEGFQVGQDLPGSDYNDYQNLKDAKACSRACAQDYGCVAWTFLPDTVNHCFVKRPDVINPSPYPKATSGYKPHVALDASKSSLKEPTRSLLMPIFEQNNLEVRIVMDNSVLEVFLNGGRYSMTTRIYPSLTSSIGIELVGIKKTTVIPLIEAWNMKDSFINFSDLPLPI